jgi:hypothetical protein
MESIAVYLTDGNGVPARYITIQECTGGYGYSITRSDFKELDGGVYDDPGESILMVLKYLLEDIKKDVHLNGNGTVSTGRVVLVDFNEISEKIENANKILA